MLIIRNARAITPRRVVDRAAVGIDRGIIAFVEPDTGQAFAGADKTIDAAGLTLSPGFIDIHTHGGGGYDFMDGTPEAFCGAAVFHARHGTTALLPTTVGLSSDGLRAVLAAWREARRIRHNGAAMPGLHLEGPYLNPVQKGAIDECLLKNPDPVEYMELLDLAGPGAILIWTAAPELPGSLEFARSLRGRGVLPSAGHSDALFHEAEAGFDSGFTHVTHLYSAMSTVRRIHAWRYGGLLEFAFFEDGMTVEVIADGCHLPPSLLRLIVKVKGPDRIALVTDSMRAAGLPEGQYTLGIGQNVIIEDGVAKLPDRSAFAGSVATADRLVRTMVNQAGVDLKDAVRMMTATPARIIGLDKRKGMLAPGLDADLVLFDGDISVKLTVVEGTLVYADPCFGASACRDFEEYDVVSLWAGSSPKRFQT